jgi:hypothetical protein
LSARSAARERNTERSALRTVLKISMSIVAETLAPGDPRQIQARRAAGSTRYRVFTAHSLPLGPGASPVHDCRTRPPDPPWRHA